MIVEKSIQLQIQLRVDLTGKLRLVCKIFFDENYSIADAGFINKKRKILFAGCVSGRYRLPHDNGK
jgi:hypothetical protein